MKWWRLFSLKNLQVVELRIHSVGRAVRVAIRFRYIPPYQLGFRLFLAVLCLMAFCFGTISVLRDSPLSALGWAASALMCFIAVASTWLQGPMRHFLVDVTEVLKTSGELKVLYPGQLLADVLVSFWSVPAMAATALPFQLPFFGKYPFLWMLDLCALLLIIGLAVLINRRPGPARPVLHVRTNFAVSTALMFYVLGVYTGALVWHAIPMAAALVPAIYCFAHAAGMLVLGFRSVPLSVQLEKRTESEHGSSKVDPGEQASVFLIWGLTTAASIYGLYLAVIAVVYAISGHHPVPSSSVATLSHALGDGFASRILSGLYATPFASLLVVLVGTRYRECRSLRLRSQSSANADLRTRLRALCVNAQCPEPVVVIERSPFVACSVTQACGRGRFLRMTDTALLELNGPLLDATLYHEIYHLTQHAWWVALMESLGRWSLAGRGLLLAAISTERLEYAADAYAVKCLQKYHGFDCSDAAEAMIGALVKTEINNGLLAGTAGSMHAPLALVDNQQIGGSPGDFRAKLNLMVELYFGDRVMFYRHPSLAERTRRLEERA